jgi:hypothetical protein
MKRVNKARILSLSAILSSVSTQIHAQTPATSETGNATYATDQCTYWLTAAQSSDLDDSGGLSENEYYTFLTSIEDPPYINDYFQQYPNFNSLPWKYRVLYRTMLCNCMRMGEGAECCVGDNIEVMFDGTASESNGVSVARQSSVADGYEKLLCQQVAVLVSTIEEPVEEVPVEETGEEPVVETVVTEPPTPTPETSDKGYVVIPTEPVYESQPVEEVETDTGLGAGAIVGILFAILVPLCGGCFILARQRKMEEEKRLREFAGEAAKEDHLASFDAMAEKRGSLPNADEIEHMKVEEPEIETDKPLPEPEVAVEAPAKEEKNDDDSDDNSSVWSGDEKDKEAEIIVDAEDMQKPTVGSALAAMGVASTVATSLASSLSKEDETKVNALV